MKLFAIYKYFKVLDFLEQYIHPPTLFVYSFISISLKHLQSLLKKKKKKIYIYIYIYIFQGEI